MYYNLGTIYTGQNTHRCTVGFLSTSLDGSELILRAVLSTKPWLRDPAVVPIPFRQDVYDEYISCDRTSERTLKLGVFWTNGIIEPHPPSVGPSGSWLKLSSLLDTKYVDSLLYADMIPVADRVSCGLKPPISSGGQENLCEFCSNQPRFVSLVLNSQQVSFLHADGANDIHEHLNLSGEPLIPPLERSFQLRDPIPLLKYQELILDGLNYEIQCSDYWNSTGDADGRYISNHSM
jgi:amidase